MKNKLNILGTFKNKLLGLYHGWILRKKILNTFMIRQHIREIKDIMQRLEHHLK